MGCSEGLPRQVERPKINKRKKGVCLGNLREYAPNSPAMGNVRVGYLHDGRQWKWVQMIVCGLAWWCILVPPWAKAYLSCL